MWGGAVDSKILSQIIDGSYVCGSKLITEKELENYNVVEANTADETIQGLFKTNGKFYLIKQDKAPTRVGPSGPVNPIYVKSN
jgi:hypothetical protein